jgi:NADH-ubiquinone oxidoreductase chain 5
LPLAIAAPTPISALVHSSTLVTAGLFLLMRFNYFFYFNLKLMHILFRLGVLTSFYAGVLGVLEFDLKKLVALSTLRHLGFILSAYRLGLLKFSFFHLIAHALFKSLLFIRFGGIITTQGHSQD